MTGRDPRTRAVLVSRLYESMRGFHTLAALAEIGVAALVWSYVPTPLLLSWLFFMLATETGLGIAGSLYRRRAQPQHAGRWLAVYGVFHLLGALGWGAIVWLFLGPMDLWHILMLAALLVCIAAIELSEMSYVAPLYAWGAGLKVAPVVVRLLAEIPQVGWSAAGYAALCGLATGALIFSAFRSYRAHIADIRLRDFLDETENALLLERKRLQEAEARLRLGESYDPLTHCLSYLGFKEMLDERLRQGAPTLIACVNINGFKRVNDAFGMHVGDLVLRALADRLAQIAGSRQKVGRISADEFVIVAPDDASGDRFSIRLLDKLKLPVELEGKSIEMTVGIGVARYPEHGTDASELMEGAIIAMRSAKVAPNEGYRIYTRSLRDQARGSLSLRLELARALERKELQLHYQPIMHLASGRVVGAEALLRWHSERLGRILPDQFIPIAENSGLIVPIGNWVINEAAAAAARLRALAPLHIAINTSIRQFAAGGLAEAIESAIRRQRIPAGALQVEITETTFMTEPDTVRRELQALHEIGVQVALDDFGTGFSSLGYLRHMNIDGLKLDRDFIGGIDTGQAAGGDNRQAAIVKSVLALAQALDVWVVAEGVEHDWQNAWLAQAGCAYGQGYHFARPMPESAFVQWLLEQQRTTPGSATLEGA